MKLYHVDTFTHQLFSGNPASVVILNTELPEKILQAIATENALPVTTFLSEKNHQLHLRWFTPEYELNLCGHGTLAAAYIAFTQLDPERAIIEFQAASGTIRAQRNNDIIFLDLPAKKIEPCAVSALLSEGLSAIPQKAYHHESDRCLVVLDSEEMLRQLKPNFLILQQLPYRGIDVTALGNDVDFVSRTFYPKKIITEDPVCGASHCLLIPYWAKELKKTKLHAYQLSKRGGELFCELHNDRILLGGRARLYMQGNLESGFSG